MKRKSLTKRITAVFLAAVLFALTGCGNKQTQKDNEAKQTESVPKSTEETKASEGENKVAKSDIVIHWYMPMAGSNMDDQLLVEEAANKIVEEKLGFTFKFHLIESGNYTEKMTTMISTGEEFDICFTGTWTNSFNRNADGGAFLPLNDLLDKYGQDILKKEDPRALTAATKNGEILTIPGQSPYSSSMSYVFKKDLIDKYNIDYKDLNTPEKLESYLALIKENEPDMIPLTKNAGGSFFNNLCDVDGAPCIRYDNNTDEFSNVFENEQWIAAKKIRKNWNDKGYFASNVLEQTDVTAEAKTGKYAVLGSTGYYSEDGSKSSGIYGFDCVESYVGNSLITSAIMLGQTNAISITSKHPEEAMQLLNLVWADPELSNTLAYGVEGIDYTVDTSNTTEKTVIPNSGSEQKWVIWHNWVGPLFDQWNSSWNSTESLRQMQENNEKGTAVKCLGFSFDSSNVRTEVAQLSAIYSEVNSVFDVGAMPDFDKYLKETQERVKEAGIDTLLEEVNKQYQEWKKANNK